MSWQLARRFPTPTPTYLASLEAEMLAVKPETGDKEANFPYPFVKNLLLRTSASEPAASSHTVTVPMAPSPAASQDATRKSADEIAMGSDYAPLMTDAPPAPWEINIWGTTICPQLLEVSSLLVCRLTRTDLSSEVEVLVKCSPKDDAPDQWHLFILAAPKKLLMLRGEETIGICKRHGSNLVAAASQNCSSEHFQITNCLHPSGHIATIFWDRIAQDSWSEVCREAVGAILSGLNLGQWQDSMMKQSLQDLKTQFRVEPGQPGFFSRPQRPDRAQEATYEQREISQEMPYEITRSKKSRRSRRNTQIPDANREPHVFRVVQDLM